MTEEHECDFPETCNVCQGPVKKPEPYWSFPFFAKYPGHCPGCNLPTHVGDLVISDGNRVWHKEHRP